MPERAQQRHSPPAAEIVSLSAPSIAHAIGPAQLSGLKWYTLGTPTMPELPELEVVREVLQRRVVGHTIDAVRVFLPGSALHRAAIKAGQAVDERRQDCIVTLLARLLPAYGAGE